MTSFVIINPGTGAVLDTQEAIAIENMVQFAKDVAKDLGIKDGDVVYNRTPENDMGDGRYSFSVTADGENRDVQMVGLPLPKVRWVDGENPWLFPRLYVGDGSWLWGYAVTMFEKEEEG